MLSDCAVAAMIPVSDLDKVRAFYTDTLGLKVGRETDQDIELLCGNGTSFGVFISQGRASGTHTQMGFETDDLDTEVATLRSRGVVFEQFDMPEITEQDGIYAFPDGRGAFFRDPEGNLLAIAEMQR